MWLVVSTPAFGSPHAVIRVERIYVSEGERLSRGQRLLDLNLDLSAGVARDCPPVSTCRLVLREEAWVRRLPVEVGTLVGAADALALLSTGPDTPPEPPSREARVTVATVLQHDDWWTAAP